MEAALERLQGGADAIAMAAAVADHRRRAPESTKLPKQALADALRSEWEPVPDLLAGLVQRRPPAQAILGFAAQSGEVLEEARAKFARKGCDLLFANPIDRAGAGFAATGNEGWLLGPGERQRHFGPTGKLALAHELLTALAEVMVLRAPVRAPADP
jgi:phosphopantothenoylcysteine decarboxylase/phosphopantothenate--cysteine ligase